MSKVILGALMGAVGAAILIHVGGWLLLTGVMLIVCGTSIVNL